MLLAALFGLVALPACERQPAPPAESPALPAEAPDRPDAPAPEAASATAARVRLRVADRRITLSADRAPRRPLLEALARELAFELVAPDVGEEPISAETKDAPLERVLPLLLPDRPYRVEYRLDDGGGRHAIARLEIAPAGARAMPGPRAEMPPVASHPAPGDRVEEPPGKPRTAGSGRDAETDWRELLLRLDDADAEERALAIREIDPDGEGLGVLIERLANDPHPRVRAAAARQLEDSDTLVAVDALVRALQDPDRDVVLEAIDALEFTDDETVAEDLLPLTSHPDPEIAEAATEARCFIIDCPEQEADPR